MNEFVYCMECDKIVPVMYGYNNLPYHTNFAMFDGELDVQECFFPRNFAFSEPPDNFDLSSFEDWEELVDEPSPEELEEMDKQAEEMLLELVGG